jgi:hypothetical protein
MTPTAAPIAAETDNPLAEARDALQRQALEIETKTALMDQQLAEMKQALKDHENAELRGSLDALKQQNDALRLQADAAREQSDALTQRIAVSPPPNVAPQPVVEPDYSLFYESLAPYGRWLEVNGYGYCWLPTINVAGWRPYVDGCWVWSALGWAWQSNEPFGWATYHYGRWLDLAGYGWVWVPGSEWSPAWVAWRQSRDCIGWAPLPPEPGVCNGIYRDCDSRYGLGPASYIFINTNQFVSTSYINVYAPVTRQTTIFQHCVNVTRIVPRTGHGHAFVNQGGPPRAQMEQACGQPVPQRQVQMLRLDQLSAQQHPHGRREAAAPLAMVELPAIKPGAHRMHPEVQEQIQRPVRMSGFEGVPQQVATEIRGTMARQKETAAGQQQPVLGHMSQEHGRHSVEPQAVVGVPALNLPPQTSVSPVMSAESSPGRTAEPMRHATPLNVTPPPRNMPPENSLVHHHAPAAAQPSPPAAMPQPPAEPGIAPQHVAAETKAAEQGAAHAAAAEKSRERVAVEQTSGAAMQHRQQQERAMSDTRATEQAATTAEAERTRLQAAVAQQQARAAQQQRMTAEQAATESERTRRLVEAAAQQQRQQQEGQARAQADKTRMQAALVQQQSEAAVQQQRIATERAEKARQFAETAAMQQQQAQAAQQQRATAERMAADQTARAQQAQAAAMQHQQEESTRRAVEEQMHAQQEAGRRATQEMAQRQAQEQSRRAAEEQMRAQQEAGRRAQEQAQHQAEAARHAQSQAEAARSQPHSGRPGS